MPVLLFLMVILIFLWDYLSKRRRYELTKNIPGPPIIPLIGNHLFLKSAKIKDLIENPLKVDGRTSRVWIGQQLLIITYDPKDIEIILGDIKHNRKNFFYKMFQPWFGESVFLLPDKKWIARRKILRHTLKIERWKGYGQVCDEQGSILVEKLKAFEGKGAFNIQPAIRAATLDIIAEICIGVKLNSQGNETTEYLQAIRTITEIMTKRVSSIFHIIDFFFHIFYPSLARLQAKTIEKHQTKFTRNIVKDHSCRQREDQTKENTKNDERQSILDIIMDVKSDEVTDEEIRGEMDGAIFAGHDSQSSAIPFTLYCISRHPDVQDRLFSEIREVFGDDKDTPIDFRKTNQLEYMDLVIKEALRLFSPVPLIGRQIAQDTMINGKWYPKETSVIIAIYRLHEDSEIFSEPDKFLPERHVGRQHAFTHVPFSAGPRNCLAKKLATMEMKWLISKILRHFELLPLGPELNLHFGVTLQSNNGINLGVRQRYWPRSFDQ